MNDDPSSWEDIVNHHYECGVCCESFSSTRLFERCPLCGAPNLQERLLPDGSTFAGEVFICFAALAIYLIVLCSGCSSRPDSSPFELQKITAEASIDAKREPTGLESSGGIIKVSAEWSR